MLAASFLDHAPFILGTFLAFSIWLAVLSRVGRRIGERPTAAAFSNRTPPTIERAATIAILGDVQRGIRDIAFPLVEALEREKAVLLVSSGDLASHGEAPYYGVVARALDAAALSVPTLVVPGNHDLQPSGIRDPGPGRLLFERAIGPRRWRTRVGDLRIFGIDDSIEPVEPDQAEWLAEGLAETSSAPYLLVCHKPPRRIDREGAPVLAGAERLVALLESRPPVAVLSGHLREDGDSTVGGVRYLVNVRGGDYEKKKWFPPKTFSLVLADISPVGAVAFRRIEVARRPSMRSAFDQLWVRCWAGSRRGVGRIVAWPGDALLKALGWS